MSEYVVPLNMAATRRSIRLAASGPIFAASALYCLGVLALALRIRSLTHGLQWYVLDDPYIHASIARNLIQHGHYAVTGSAFTPASSSILWPYLLAAIFLISGVHAITPLVLAVASGLFLLFSCDRLLKIEEVPAKPRLFALLLITLCTPAVVLTFTGMETLLFAAATILFLHVLLRTNLNSTGQSLLSLALAATFLSGVRYEGLFVIAVAVLLLTLNRRWIAALTATLAGGAPIVLFGLYAVHRGASFLPNSLLIKTAQTQGPFWPNFISGAGHGIFSLYAFNEGLTLLFLLNATLICLLIVRRATLRQITAPAVFLETTLLHCALSRLGWFWRYESYLIALGICSALIATRYLTQPLTPREDIYDDQPPPRGYWVLAICVVLTIILSARTITPLRTAPEAALAIYRQQFQTARFLARAYPHRTIAVNDVGAVSFFSPVECLDLFGLANNQVARLKHLDTPEANLDAASIEALARQRKVPVAILYEDWFPDLPESWEKVEGWTIPHTSQPIILGGDRVVFYATSPAEIEPLRQALDAFHASLPHEIAITPY